MTDFHKGLCFALSAFVFWGLTPIYFKAVVIVSPLEVLSHRILWSVLVLLVVLTLRKQWQSVRALKIKALKPFLFSSVLISLNWLIFIWAIGQNRILETSLGYFINPLVSVVLGMLFLGERLRRFQVVAVALALLGVLNQIWLVGTVPWIALCLAFSFGFYGLIRKTFVIDPGIGLFLETSLLLPLAMAYLFYLSDIESLSFGHSAGQTDLLLIFAGLVTTIPLLLFAAGTKRLSLTVMGLAQYTAPTMTFLLAVFLYHEPFTQQHLLTFSCIWLGLTLFTFESLLFHKQQTQAESREEKSEHHESQSSVNR